MIEVKVKRTREKTDKFIKSASLNLNQAVAKAALIVERSAKEIVPVDTGNLRNSITTRVEGNRAVIGTSVEYAANVELGINQRRQPYLTPALLLNKEKIRNKIMAEIRKQIKKEVGE